MLRLRRAFRKWTPAAVVGAWTALAAATASGSALQGPPAARSELGLAEVRSSFTQLDADADGRLDRTQAEAGDISGEQFAQFDANADSRLDAEEFLVARHALAARAGRRVAADLSAESTRIQVAWRARRAPGPSSRVEAARKPQVAPKAGAGEASVPPGPPAPAGTTRAAESAGATATPESADPKASSGSSSGPGIGRLRQGVPSSSTSSPEDAASLEARARTAQELILARRKESGAPARSPIVVEQSRGPASRTTVAGTASRRNAAPSASRTTRQPARPQPAPPQSRAPRNPKPRSDGGN